MSLSEQQKIEAIKRVYRVAGFANVKITKLGKEFNVELGRDYFDKWYYSQDLIHRARKESGCSLDEISECAKIC